MAGSAEDPTRVPHQSPQDVDRTTGPRGTQGIPKLPRQKGFRLRSADVVRIGMVATLLVCVIALGRPCADGVAGFFESFAPPPDAAPSAPALQLERLTEEEIMRRFPHKVPQNTRGTRRVPSGNDAGVGAAPPTAPR